MPTFFLDPVGGNDANDGLSFANRWRTFTNGATAARLAAGDIIRVMKSPDPTSIGNCTWVSDFGRVNDTKTISSSTNASPIAVTCTAHGYSTGDWVYITGHTVNTNANGLWRITSTGANTFTLNGSTGNGVGGASGTFWRASNMVVTTPSAYVENISDHLNRGNGAVAWTASANVTTSLELTQILFTDNVQQIAIAAGFTTGLAARISFASKNLSGYQQLSFMIRQTAGTLATSGQIRINLCSDTNGATVVDTFDVPAIGALNAWHTFTVNKGSALGSAIQSVALYVQTDVAAQTFQISNIIACRAPSDATSVTLRSLIGKDKPVDDSDNDCWFAIRAIIGDAIVLAPPQGILINATSNFGYHGTSESVTTYKREAFELNVGTTSIPASATTTAVQTYLDSGSATFPIVYSGGWDTTNMSTQDGETFFDGRNGLGVGLGPSGSRSGNNFERMGFVRFTTGISIGLSESSGTDLYLAACATGLTTAPTAANLGCYFTRIKAAGCTTAISGGRCTLLEDNSFVNCDISTATYQRQSGGTIRLHNGRITGNNADDVQYVGTLKIWLPDTASSAMYGITMVGCDDFHFADVTVTSEASSITGHNAIRVTNSDGIANLTATNINTAVFIASGELSMQRLNTSGVTTPAAFSQLFRGQVYIQSLNGGNPEIDGDAFSCSYDPTMAGANTLGRWNCVISAARRTLDDPVIIPICRMPVVANKLCTAKLYVDTNASTQYGGLFILGGQVAGVESNISSLTNATSWTEVTLTFTPTQAGVVEINAFIYSTGTANVSFDEFSFSQADQSWSVVANKMNVLQQGRIYIGPEAVTSGGGGPSGGIFLNTGLTGGFGN